jgi:selenophosphate synthetase-related protein
MLLHCSGVGAELWIDRLPKPPDADLNRWLVSFPSFGYLLSVAPEFTALVSGLLAQRGIACERVGRITAEKPLILTYENARCEFSAPASL